MTGCVATVKMSRGPLEDMVFEFTVPAWSYPGSTVEFHDKHSTGRKIRVKLHELITNGYTRLDSSVIIRCRINTFEADAGQILAVENFDGSEHTVKVPPGTTANRLIYHIEGAGFYERDTTYRGNLTIIVEVE